MKYSGITILQASQRSGLPAKLLGALVKSRFIHGQRINGEFLISDSLLPQLSKLAAILKEKEVFTFTSEGQNTGRTKNNQRRTKL